MIVLLGAMREEIAGLRRKMVIEETYTEHGYDIYKGKYGNKDVLLAQTGIGKKQAERTAKYILEHYAVTTLISLGFAGALVKRLEVGDVILGTTLYCEDNQMSPNQEIQNPICSDVSLISIASQIQECMKPQLYQAGTVSVLNPICEPIAKLALGKTFSSEAVDMESYWIAELASARCIPFLNIRVISDTAVDRLPPFDRFFDSGKWRFRRAVPYFLTHPQQLVGLFRFYLNIRLARKSLTSFMDSFINKL